jgi:CrcB protein
MDEQEPRFRLGSKGEPVKQLFLVLGSGFGGGARYLVAGWFIKAFGVGFPFGIIAINIIGSLLIGLIMEVALGTNLISGEG